MRRPGVGSGQCIAPEQRDEFLACGDIEAVSVVTPSGMHSAHAIAAARAGKHVVVEKPMALRLQDADAMIRACDAAAVKLFVVKQNRFNVWTLDPGDGESALVSRSSLL